MDDVLRWVVALGKGALVGYLTVVLTGLAIEIWIGAASLFLPIGSFNVSIGSVEIIQFIRSDGGFSFDSGPLLSIVALTGAVVGLVLAARRQQRRPGFAQRSV